MSAFKTEFKKNNPHNLKEAANQAASCIYATGLIKNGPNIFAGGNNVRADFAAKEFNKADLEILRKSDARFVAEVISLRQAYAQSQDVALLKKIYGQVQTLKKLGWKPLDGEPGDGIPSVKPQVK